MKGILFDIKHYAIHDGPGIRTTLFLKGCPLHCPWCHNPEGISPQKEIFLRADKCRPGCRACLDVCPLQALTKTGSVVEINRKTCDGCGLCEEACVYGALEIVGKEMSVEEVLAELEKDRIFFEESEGGVTFSGGEPLAQPEFLHAVLVGCGEKGFHRALDTSGYADFSDFNNIIPHVDLFLYDLKMIDNEKHLCFTGYSNSLILGNLTKLAQKGNQLWIRIPLIKGINDDDSEIKAMGQFLKKIGSIREIQLLPYHKGMAGKWKRLQQEDPSQGLESPGEERLNKIVDILTEFGLKVKAGG
ncbi:MAG: glycyl-radical enzyme activating protein [Acidobacteriota bacterium]